MNPKTKRRLLIGLVLAAALTVWFAAPQFGDTVVVQTDPAPSSRPTSNRFSQVEPASQQQIRHVTRFLHGGLQIRDAHVLGSWREEQSYYFAASVYGARGGKRLGMWLVGGTKADPDMVLSVNAVADAVSTAPWGPDSGSSIYDTETDILADYYEP